jgi:hypothetical protein
MKNYFVKKIDETTFKVIETKTDFVIRTANTHKHATTLAGSLNKGKGFAGETPHFFINKKEQVVV